MSGKTKALIDVLLKQLLRNIFRNIALTVVSMVLWILLSVERRWAPDSMSGYSTTRTVFTCFSPHISKSDRISSVNQDGWRSSERSLELQRVWCRIVCYYGDMNNAANLHVIQEKQRVDIIWQNLHDFEQSHVHTYLADFGSLCGQRAIIC